MRLLNRVQVISIAVILFICLHYLLTLISNYLANNLSDFPVYLPWLNLTAYLLYLLIGFVASVLSKEQFIFVGLIAGLISALSAVLLFSVGGSIYGVFVTLVSGLVLGGIGGGLSLIIKRKLKNAL